MCQCLLYRMLSSFHVFLVFSLISSIMHNKSISITATARGDAMYINTTACRYTVHFFFLASRVLKRSCIGSTETFAMKVSFWIIRGTTLILILYNFHNYFSTSLSFIYFYLGHNADWQIWKTDFVKPVVD